MTGQIKGRLWTEERLREFHKNFPNYTSEDLRDLSGWSKGLIEETLGIRDPFQVDDRAERGAKIWLDHVEDDWPTLSVLTVSKRVCIDSEAILKVLRETPKFKKLKELGIVNGPHPRLKAWQKHKGYNSTKDYRGMAGHHGVGRGICF